MSVSISKPLAEFQKAETVQPELSDLNPFSAMGAGIETVCPKLQMESTPGPSKRARPVESTSQRVASKPSKAKGKAPLATKEKKPASFTFSASLDSVRGSSVQTHRRTKKLCSTTEPILKSVSGVPQ